jgi:hypothetical protein
MKTVCQEQFFDFVKTPKSWGLKRVGIHGFTFTSVIAEEGVTKQYLPIKHYTYF